MLNALRRRVTHGGTAAILVVVLLAGGSVARSGSPPDPAPSAATAAADQQRRGFVFASMPDFLNQDVADLRTARCSRWKQGDPNSEVKGYEEQISRVLDEVARSGAKDLLVAGDSVEGRWGRDDERTGIFGPVHTYRQKVEAVRRAACAYYPAWRQRFAAHGLRILPAVGDHELGDDGWVRARGGYEAFKWRAHGVFKKAWVRHVGRGVPRASHPRGGQAVRTAYATRLRPDVLLVTMYDFVRTPSAVRLGIDAAQLRWLRATLARAERQGVDWVLVQGHAPVLRPVRASHASGPSVTIPGGRRSAFWRLLARYDVDLYLCGEVHATSAVTADGVIQVCHGGRFYAGDASFLVGQVSGHRLLLRSRAFHAKVLHHGTGKLWQTDRRVGGSGVRYSVRSHPTGRLEMTSQGRVLRRGGLLREYQGG